MIRSTVIYRSRIPQAIAAITRRTDHNLEQVAKRGVDIARQLMEESPPTGRIYGRHIASAPGNPPRIKSRDLWNSMQPIKVAQGQWAIEAGETYAGELEFGGTTAVPEARPFMGPMSRQLQGEFSKFFVKEPIILQSDVGLF